MTVCFLFWRQGCEVGMGEMAGSAVGDAFFWRELFLVVGLGLGQ